MGDAGVLPDARLKPAKLLSLVDELALFVLNVGDGDSLVIRFPPEGTDPRPSFGIIDSFVGYKTIALLDDLGPGRLRFVCATHPHLDHIQGLREVLQRFSGQIDEFWDSGFRYTSTTYRALVDEVVRQSSTIRLIRPTSGYEVFYGAARVTVLSPSIALRNRYDTYGVDVNNASIVMRVTYPMSSPALDYPGNAGAGGSSAPPSRTLILGGDAQTDAWGQVLQEYPHLDPEPRNWARMIGSGSAPRPLACDLLKVSHHASKRGVNLELLERMGDRGSGPSNGPRFLVSSCASGAASGYGFPHRVTQELIREVRDPQAQRGAAHPPDDRLGIHYTSQVVDNPAGPAGSISYVVDPAGAAVLYRLGDGVDDPVNLANARQLKA